MIHSYEDSSIGRPAWFHSAVMVVLAVVMTSAATADTITVSTFSALRTAAVTADPGDVIIVAPGTYHVTQNLYLLRPNFTIRGQTGDPDDVVLHGDGMNVNSGVLEGIWTAAEGIRLENLTFRDFWHHGIHVAGDPLASNVVISNCKTINCGERHVKGSGYGVSSNVLIEDLWMEQTEAYLPRPDHSVDENNYIGGIDAMQHSGWTIRRCVAKNIMGAAQSSRAGIFLWNGVENVTVENNLIIRCGHGISIGNPSGPKTTGPLYPWHAIGGIIRNNVILRAGLSIDNWALELDNVKDLKVYNNTVYSEDAGYFRALQILDDAGVGEITNLDFRNNIIRGGVLDITTAGTWGISDVRAMGNIVDNLGTQVTPAWFVNAAGGDLHLTDLATDAIDQAATLADITIDFDGQARSVGAAPDMGADEWLSADFDGDLDVDHDDLVTLALAMAGPGQPAILPEADLDGDNDCDLADVAEFSAQFTGS